MNHKPFHLTDEHIRILELLRRYPEGCPLDKMLELKISQYGRAILQLRRNGYDIKNKFLGIVNKKRHTMFILISEKKEVAQWQEEEVRAAENDAVTVAEGAGAIEEQAASQKGKGLGNRSEVSSLGKPGEGDECVRNDSFSTKGNSSPDPIYLLTGNQLVWIPNTQ